MPYTEYEYNDELYHYGKKGMKWGIRNISISGSSSGKSGAKNAANNIKKTAKDIAKQKAAAKKRESLKKIVDSASDCKKKLGQCQEAYNKIAGGGGDPKEEKELLEMIAYYAKIVELYSSKEGQAAINAIGSNMDKMSIPDFSSKVEKLVNEWHSAAQKELNRASFDYDRRKSGGRVTNA